MLFGRPCGARRIAARSTWQARLPPALPWQRSGGMRWVKVYIFRPQQLTDQRWVLHCFRGNGRTAALSAGMGREGGGGRGARGWPFGGANLGWSYQPRLRQPAKEQGRCAAWPLMNMGRPQLQTESSRSSSLRTEVRLIRVSALNNGAVGARVSRKTVPAPPTPPPCLTRCLRRAFYIRNSPRAGSGLTESRSTPSWTSRYNRRIQEADPRAISSTSGTPRARPQTRQ